MKLPYHDRAIQMQPDKMHTIAYFINHLMDMLTGKHDSSSVRNCEKNSAGFQRYGFLRIIQHPPWQQHRVPKERNP